MRPLLTLLGLLSLCSLPSLAHAQAKVLTFSPEGTVKAVRQVTARFSEQMVPFGDLRLADPFKVDCAEPGTGRWVDGANWVYDFARDVPGALACSFTLRPGLLDLAGKPVTGPARYTFNTGGPAVLRSLPHEGAYIDEQQIFVLGLDVAATEASVAASAYCKVDGINERIGLRLLGGKERDAVLALQKDFVKHHLGLDAKGAGRIVVAQCQRTLPAGRPVTLVWGKGVAAANGLASSDDQPLAYNTRDDFTATFSCDRVRAKGPCIPFLPMLFQFSAPLSKQQARAITLTDPAGKVVAPTFDKDDDKSEYLTSMTFQGPFAESTVYKLALPPGLKDDAGRALINGARFPITVKTSAQPALVKFAARFGILEAKGERLLPVTMRNVEAMAAGKVGTVGGMLRVDGSAGPQDEKVMAWLKRLNEYGYGFEAQSGDELRKSVFKKDEAAAAQKLTLPKPNGASAFEVIGIPLPKPGFYIVELKSPMLGAYLFDKKRTPAFVHAAALVTNLAAHFKHGKDSSLVWVTSLDKGAPVPGAAVSVRDCHGKQLFNGVTDGSGIARIRTPLRNVQCNKHDAYFVSARLADDFTFTVSDWNSGIEAWRFNLPMGSMSDDNIIATTVFDRTLLRAGETVHMKHLLRRHTTSGLAMGGAGGNAELVHEGSGERFPLKLTWANGSAASQWAIPAGAKQGSYSVMLGQRMAGQFQVEQFRVPTMRALVRGPKDAVIAQSKLDLDVQVSYLSGGGASLAPVKIRTLVQGKPVSFAGYEEFSLAAGDVREGVERSEAGSDDEECCNEGEEEGGAGDAADRPARTRSATLDKAGGARIALDQLPVSDTPRDLLAEVSYADANGETLTASTRIALWPSRYVVGIKPDSWVASKDAFKFQALVLDVAGKPVSGTQVTVDFFQRTNYSHRRRLMGGFYAYENSSEVKRLGTACEGMTDARGLLHCAVKPPADGNLILRARAIDEKQRVAVTRTDVWIAGSSNWWFNVSDNDRIDLMPVKKQYEPGEQATFQVRSPFRTATALVTVEREGIIDTYLRRLSGSNPTFSIPVKGAHAPNIFVSALLVRGRVEGIKPTALVDLGKPAYKLGIASIRVGWRAHELKVQVTADKAVYKVRDKAAVTVRVTRADGSRAPAGTEIALAAVDEGLLELKPNNSWNLLVTMMAERSLQVETSTAQMQVIGKRHFGRKAFPHGGGGGASASAGRELFDTLLFWQARVVLDANGEARVQVPLNDSLTAFRIVAIANGKSDLFGTGKTTVRSSQDLMLMSGLPALVREGDRLQAGVTLRNASPGELKVNVGASVAADGAAGKALARQEITLPAGQSQEIGWDFQVPAGASTLAWTLDAAGGTVTDKLTVTQKVTSAVPVRTIQATLVQLDKPVSMKVQAPADALPGRGALLTHMSARLGGDLPGVREFMQRYPYTCLEQRTSRAVALRDEAMWARNMDSLPAHIDGDGLAKYFVTERLGGDTLTAYLLSIADEAGYAIPAELRERMEKGLLDFIEGRVTRGSELKTADLAVRKIAALEALSRKVPLKGTMLESFSIEPNLWPTSAVIDWYLVLARSAALPERAARMEQAAQILRARLTLQGTTMGFSTERSDEWWWLMVSADVNANRLLLAMLDNPAWQSDMGRLARGTLGRHKKGRWSTTVANAWGVLAIEKFSEKFEKDSVTGTTRVQLGVSSRDSAWSNEVAPSVAHPWQAGAPTLALTHTGGGKPWATVQSTAAIPLKGPLTSGYRASKTITPVEQKVRGRWSRGDIYRVALDLEAQADMTWVVVDDPIPASATVLGAGLARDSVIATGGERRTGWVQPVFEERTFESFRAYYSFVPKGKWRVEYTVRLNNEGRFSLPPTHVEAMYSPEMFGDYPNPVMEVGK